MEELDTKATHVPESYLKKRSDAIKQKAEDIAARKAAKAAGKAKRADYFKRAEKYVAEYKKTERDLINARRTARATGNYFVEPEAKVAVVIRIRGIMGVSPKVRKILRLLRLRRINNAVFVRLNKATLQMLQLVAPYIAWGYPNQKTVKELIYKRGFGRVNKQHVALTDNSIIEKALSVKTGGDVICIEDLIYQIFTCGSSFKQANSFLAPFSLSSPRGGFKGKLIGANEGGLAGLHEDRINAIVQKML
jgi:large subunit ribosomal protein L7e